MDPALLAPRQPGELLRARSAGMAGDVSCSPTRCSLPWGEPECARLPSINSIICGEVLYLELDFKVRRDTAGTKGTGKTLLQASSLRTAHFDVV